MQSPVLFILKSSIYPVKLLYQEAQNSINKLICCHLKSGLYFLQIKMNDTQIIKRFILEKAQVDT